MHMAAVQHWLITLPMRCAWIHGHAHHDAWMMLAFYCRYTSRMMQAQIVFFSASCPITTQATGSPQALTTTLPILQHRHWHCVRQSASDESPSNADGGNKQHAQL